MYGQTNCWVHPDINYIAYTLLNGDVYISTKRAARNMAYQDFFKEEGKIQIALELTGKVIFIFTIYKEKSAYNDMHVINNIKLIGHIRTTTRSTSYI